MSDDAEQSDIDTVMKAIEKMDGVQSVDFTTKDEAPAELPATHEAPAKSLTSSMA